jgi:hypothetical protein
MKVFGAMVVGAAFIAATSQGCGGGSSGTNTVDLCNRLCTKTVECAGGFITLDQCKAQCTSETMSSGGQRCTNEAAIVSKVNECLAKPDCPMFIQCGMTVPECAGSSSGAAGTGSSGAGGTTGAAGSSSTGAAGFTFDGSVPFDASGLLGSGGSAGSTCGTACVKAEACCKALPGANPASCNFVAQCNAATNPDQIVQACNGVLQTSAFFGAQQPAACK